MTENTEPDFQEVQEDNCGFKWDDESQLYFHASSGFYHDPSAGWYYSSRDGLYYKFENGNYVLLESEKGDQPELNQCGGTDEPTTACTECVNSDLHENPPPPSEWLEDTLIDLYLSGYSNQAINAACDTRVLVETDGMDSSNLSADGNDDSYELEEGEWIPDDSHGATDSSGNVLDEVASWDEENWRAQYGQVIQSGEESVPDLSAVDLWDWTIIAGTRKDGKGQVARLVGRLVKPSTKLHPSMPSRGGVLKTAPIREVRLDLVRVTSGQIYKLRSPSARYLGSLPTYDSSNPTKDWGFPELSMDKQMRTMPKSSGKCESEMTEEVPSNRDLSLLPDGLSASRKHKSHGYRDRAAERRALHGGYGVSPGQKKSSFDVDFAPSSSVSASPEEAAVVSLNMSFGAGSYARKIPESKGWKEHKSHGYRDRASERRALHGGYGVSPGQKKSSFDVDFAPTYSVSASPEEAAAESLNMSFGAGSYARKILENMGWKEGEALGNSTKGLTEPLQAVGNKGNAGLGWDQSRRKYN
ncbi:uncharacterized protein LOC132304329 [Cornus florida]|uniref:uncharacterized protein LOC132304329 n=1 Tax=Cornus florida TaxID=4283 RepID=UPI00289DAF86|nr:uncharacterized protein LOC132304329 [Cornus florida]